MSSRLLSRARWSLVVSLGLLIASCDQGRDSRSLEGDEPEVIVPEGVLAVQDLPKSDNGLAISFFSKEIIELNFGEEGGVFWRAGEKAFVDGGNLKDFLSDRDGEGRQRLLRVWAPPHMNLSEMELGIGAAIEAGIDDVVFAVGGFHESIMPLYHPAEFVRRDGPEAGVICLQSSLMLRIEWE